MAFEVGGVSNRAPLSGLERPERQAPSLLVEGTTPSPLVDRGDVAQWSSAPVASRVDSGIHDRSHSAEPTTQNESAQSGGGGYLFDTGTPKGFAEVNGVLFDMGIPTGFVDTNGVLFETAARKGFVDVGGVLFDMGGGQFERY